MMRKLFLNNQAISRKGKDKFMLEVLKDIFIRELEKLEKEIVAYKDEQNLWVVDQDILNCSGNLCLHLVGNLNAFIGAELGSTGYVRQRALEFSLKNVSRIELIKMIRETSIMIDTTLTGLDETDLNKIYRIPVFGDQMTTIFFLTHLATHLSYHLGQINYHRRLLDL